MTNLRRRLRPRMRNEERDGWDDQARMVLIQSVDSVMLSVRRENLAQTNQQWRIYWPSWIKSPEIQKASGMVLSGLWFCFSEILSSLPSSTWYCFHRIVSLLWQNAVKQNTGYMLLHLLLREREDHLQGSWGKNSSVWPCGCHDGQDKGRRWPSKKEKRGLSMKSTLLTSYLRHLASRTVRK